MCSLFVNSRLTPLLLCAVEYIHSKILFLLGTVIVAHMKRVTEGEEYLDSAKERAGELVKCIYPDNLQIESHISLVYEVSFLFNVFFCYSISLITICFFLE